jgi:hypothetical protein
LLFTDSAKGCKLREPTAEDCNVRAPQEQCPHASTFTHPNDETRRGSPQTDEIDIHCTAPNSKTCCGKTLAGSHRNISHPTALLAAIVFGSFFAWRCFEL